jgi:hypothetical protein
MLQRLVTKSYILELADDGSVRAVLHLACERATMVRDPFIVISDTHFGLDPHNQPRLLSFLRWIYTTAEAQNGVLISHIKGKNGPVKAPRTMVLLDDVLELWAPDCEDFFASIEEAWRL